MGRGGSDQLMEQSEHTQHLSVKSSGFTGGIHAVPKHLNRVNKIPIKNSDILGILPKCDTQPGRDQMLLEQWSR